jgi:hypothetical protein
LFEGNVCQNIAVDQAWGPSGPRNVFFRNRAELYGFIITSGTIQSDSQAVAGSTLPSTAPFTGLYLFSGTGHFTYGNTVQGVIQPSGTSALSDSSCYLDSVPDFMYTVNGFPPIGTGGSGAETNAAKLRFTNGASPAICGQEITTVNEVPADELLPLVNYREGTIEISMQKASGYDFSSVFVSDISGRVLLKSYPIFAGETTTHSVLLRLKQGIYFATFSGNGINRTVPFYVN